MSDVTKEAGAVSKAQVNMILVFTTPDGKFDHTGDCHVNDTIIACDECYRDSSKDRVHRAIIDHMEEEADGRLHVLGKLYIANGQNVQGKNQVIDVWVEKPGTEFAKGRAGWTIEAGTVQMTPSMVNVGLIYWK